MKLKKVVEAVQNAWYWVRCHTYNRYHVINVSGEDGEYDWGWQDADHRMLLACFKLLREFVEQEDPGVGLRTVEDYLGAGEPLDSDIALSVRKQVARERRVRELYVWWTATRPRLHRLSDGSDTVELYEQDQRRLHQLVELRGGLWT